MRPRDFLFVLLAAFVVGAWGEPPSRNDASPSLDAKVLLRQVPRSAKDVEDRIALAHARITALNDLPTAPAPGAADETAAPTGVSYQAILDAWEGYLKHLERFATLKSTLVELTSPKHVAESTEQLAQLQRETDALTSSPPAGSAPVQKIESVQAQVEALRAQVDVLSETQTQRTQMLAAGYQRQEDQLNSELSDLRAAKENPETKADNATGPADADKPKRVQLEQEEADVRIAATELALATLPMERQEVELRSKEDERLLQAKRKKIEALSRHLAALRAAQSRSRLETLLSQRAAATDPTEVGMLDLKLLAEKTLVFYFQQPDALAALERRFPPKAMERINERIALSRAYWDRSLEALAYATGEEADTLDEQLRAETADTSKDLNMVRTRLARTLDESQELQLVREKVRKRFSDLADKLGT